MTGWSPSFPFFFMLNFLILGDWGHKGTSGQLAVTNGMARVAKQLKSRFVVTTGDNFYDGVTGLHDAHWQELRNRLPVALAANPLVCGFGKSRLPRLPPGST